MRLNYAIVFVSDMRRSVAFYRDVLGLPLRFESPGWTEFVTGDASLVLHATEVAQYADPDGLAISVGEDRAGDPHGDEGARE